MYIKWSWYYKREIGTKISMILKSFVLRTLPTKIAFTTCVNKTSRKTMSRIQKIEQSTKQRALNKKWSFPRRISPVNKSKSAINCGSACIYERYSWRKTLLFVSGARRKIWRYLELVSDYKIQNDQLQFPWKL